MNWIDAWGDVDNDLEDISTFKDNYEGFNATLWKKKGKLELQFLRDRCPENEIEDFSEWLVKTLDMIKR